MRIKITTLTITLTILCFMGKAQNAMSLYFLETIPQSNFTNVAHAPRANIVIGVPVINSIFLRHNSNLAINRLVQSHDGNAISVLNKHYDFDKIYSKIGKRAYIKDNIEISPIFFGFRMNHSGYLTVSISEKIKTNIRFDKDVFSMADKTFPDGSKYDLHRTGIDFQAYQELAVGYSRNLSQKLRIGGRIKLLQGLSAIKTDITRFDLTTTKRYWDVGVDGAVYSSGPLDITTNPDGSIDEVSLKKEIEDGDIVTLIKDNALNFANNGIAVDLGATYQINDAFSVAASVNDLGFIRWRKNLNSLHLNGDYRFEGAIVNNDNIDTVKVISETILDSLKQHANYHTENQAFTTGLGTNINIGGQYHVNHAISVGLLSRSTIGKEFFYQVFNISTNFNFYGAFTASLNYNIAITGENTAGLALGLRAGMVQFYTVLDHIPTSLNKYNIDGSEIPAPTDGRQLNFMLGVNILFGTGGFKDQPKINSYSAF